LRRTGANIVDQVNGLSGQTLNLYDAFWAADSYKRFAMTSFAGYSTMLAEAAMDGLGLLNGVYLGSRANETVHLVSLNASRLIVNPSTHIELIPANNVVEQRSGTSSQTLKIYRTYTDASNYRGLSLSNTATEIELSTFGLGTGAGEGGLRLPNNRTVTFPDYFVVTFITMSGGALYFGGGTVGSQGSFSLGSGAAVIDYGRAGGFGSATWIVLNGTGGGIRLNFEGSTNAHPSLKRNGAELQARVADDTAFTFVEDLYRRKGAGTPEGAVTAPIGAVYHRTDGGAGTSFYVKESGAGNTGWVAK
jgi:hypothetical protein